MSFVLPGTRLCAIDTIHKSGIGTYVEQDYIFSKYAGVVRTVNKDKFKIIEVYHLGKRPLNLVPADGDIILAQVTVIYTKFCKCIIKGTKEGVYLGYNFKAFLRLEHVQRGYENFNMYDCFHPGDFIYAKVLPRRNWNIYQLTTAENELGVISAVSKGGHKMIPISWTQMQCPKTYVKENRKVAKFLPTDDLEVSNLQIL